ncbi:MAG: hypothetical protein NC829_01180, partial [Candidatus Omnitrophica bacterium]|nr:hypothetical protein [Candidatus Omnitrophota bacterium]
MRLFLVLLLCAGVIFLSSCKKKSETLIESQVPLSIEMIPTTNITNVTANITTAASPAKEATVTSSAEAPLLEVPIPQGPYKPTNQEIQTALKNAGYYTAEIDG